MSKLSSSNASQPELTDGGVIDPEIEAMENLSTAPIIPPKPEGAEDPQAGQKPADPEKPKAENPRDKRAASMLSRASGEFFSGLGVESSQVVSDGVGELGQIVLEESAGVKGPWLRAGIVTFAIALAATPAILVTTGVLEKPDREPVDA